MRKKVLVFCFSDLSKDPRVRKQIFALKERYEILTVGFTKSGIQGVEEHPILQSELKMSWRRKISFMKSLLFNDFNSFYWNDSNKSVYSYLKRLEFDVIMANDLEALPICNRLARDRDIKCIGDLHEYYPGQGGNNSNLYNKYNSFLCKKHLKDVHELITVSESIGKLYGDNFDVNVNYIITNATNYYDLSPSTLDPNRIDLVHHGIASRSRDIGQMIALTNLLDERFRLHFYLVGDQSYIDELKALSIGENVVFHNPVSRDILISSLNHYDIGLYFLDDSIINHKYCLPNKLFEFIQARLMIAITPNVEMKKFVDRYQIGIVGSSFSIEEIANQLNQLSTRDVVNYKSRTNVAADRERDEYNYVKIMSIVDGLID